MVELTLHCIFWLTERLWLARGDVDNRTTLRAGDRGVGYWHALQHLRVWLLTGFTTPEFVFHVKPVKTSWMRGKGPGFRRRWKNV